MNDWDERAPLCGNCRFWPLGGYQHNWEGCQPGGIGGPGTDGSMSDCRAKAAGEYEWPGYGKRQWPQVRREDWCGEFQLRRETHRRPRS